LAESHRTVSCHPLHLQHSCCLKPRERPHQGPAARTKNQQRTKQTQLVLLTTKLHNANNTSKDQHRVDQQSPHNPVPSASHILHHNTRQETPTPPMLRMWPPPSARLPPHPEQVPPGTKNCFTEQESELLLKLEDQTFTPTQLEKLRKSFCASQSRAALSLLGFCYYHIQDFSSAAECYEQLTQLHPEVEEYKLYYAQSLYKAGAFPEATRASFVLDNSSSHTKLLLEQLPQDDPDYVYNMGCLLYQDGKYEDACKKFMTAMQMLGYVPVKAAQEALTDMPPRSEEVTIITHLLLLSEFMWFSSNPRLFGLVPPTAQYKIRYMGGKAYMVAVMIISFACHAPIKINVVLCFTQ
ncbi:hypothetical protein XENOCAPTIV_002792, partial [Xenoophorus captivus]